MSFPIAELTARLGFDADYRKLKEFEKRVQASQKKLNAYADRVQKNVNKSNKTRLSGLVAVEKRINKERGQLWQLRQDYMRTNNLYREGNLSYERRSRILTELNTKYRQIKRESLAVNRQIAATPIGRLRQGVQNFNERVRGNTGTPKGNGRVTAGAAGGAMVAGGAAIAPAAIVGAATMMANASNRLYREFDSLRQGLIVTEGNRERADSMLEKLWKTSDKLGQRMMDVTANYRQMAAALDGTPIQQQALEISTAMSAFATSMGLTPYELKGLERSLSDMASLGTVSGQDVRQLANWDVSRTQMANAVGMTVEQFNDAVSNSDLSSYEFLPKLASLMMDIANRGGALEQRAQSTQAQQNRAINELLKTNIIANETGINYYFNQVYQAVQNFARSATPLIEELGEAFEGLAPTVRANIEAMGNTLGALGNLFDSMDGTEIKNPLPRLSDILNGLANSIDDLAGFVDIIRDSKNSAIDKLNGFGDLVWDQFVRTFETIVNFFVDKANAVLPGDPISRLDLSKATEAIKDKPVIGLKESSETTREIREKVTEVSERIPLILNKETIKERTFNNNTNTSTVLKEPLVDLSFMKSLVEQGNRRFEDYPSNHPMYREPKETVINQNIQSTINIDGADDPDAILGTIEDHMSKLMREASLNETTGER